MSAEDVAVAMRESIDRYGRIVGDDQLGIDFVVRSFGTDAYLCVGEVKWTLLQQR